MFRIRRRICKENSSKLLWLESSRLWLSLRLRWKWENHDEKRSIVNFYILPFPRHYTINKFEFISAYLSSDGFQSSNLIGFSIKIFRSCETHRSLIFFIPRSVTVKWLVSFMGSKCLKLDSLAFYFLFTPLSRIKKYFHSNKSMTETIKIKIKALKIISSFFYSCFMLPLRI